MEYLKLLVKKIIPRRYHAAVRYILISILYFGVDFKCPCCGGHFRKRRPYEADRKCPRCGCLKRHRLLWVYLRNRTDFFTAQKKVLHISPLLFLQKKCKSLRNLDYVSVDILSSMVMIRMDITDIATPDNQFDCIICYHVLEHVPDDVKAMRELLRVLRPGGWAILQSAVRQNLDKTYEDPNIVSPEERRQVFGHRDHVRIYGRDYKDRLERAGFTVRLDNYVKELEDDKIKEFDLPENEIVYFCAKPKPKDEWRETTSHNSG